jgi:hypothetical protein
VLICNPKLVKVGLDLISFPTVMYVSFPTSVSDLRQSSRRPYRIGQTQPVKVIFFVYPTMEANLLRLLALKMKASLMVEGKLPGEGLVTFGEEESENETEMVLHLAREILASLEKGETQTDMMQRAQELQDLFKENTRIEQEKNQLLNQDEPVEVDFKPIIVESFPPAEPLDEHSEQEANLPGETSPVTLSSPSPGDASKGVKRAAKTRKKATQATDERITVTIIQTGITSGKDPWAALRDKYLPAKKRRTSRKGMPEGHPDLWSLVENTVVEQAPVVQQDEETTGEEFQQLTLF